MKPAFVVLLSVLTLMACGADGPPQAPDTAEQPQVNISGQARFGISRGL